MLKARSDGNQDLHRFLAIADGVVRAQGRKIIFTTNLPNIRDLDDALLRPGRCFKVVHTRLLGGEEIWRLVARLCAGDLGRQRAARAALVEAATRAVSVAQIYRACEDSGGESVCPNGSRASQVGMPLESAMDAKSISV
jgi:ATP-dependent 26S proteasome regulatory subunit